MAICQFCFVICVSLHVYVLRLVGRWGISAYVALSAHLLIVPADSQGPFAKAAATEREVRGLAAMGLTVAVLMLLVTSVVRAVGSLSRGLATTRAAAMMAKSHESHVSFIFQRGTWNVWCRWPLFDCPIVAKAVLGQRHRKQYVFCT